MKYTLIKVGNVNETAEKLNGLDEFNALGLPYPAKVFNNWEAGAPKDEYPEWVLAIRSYTEEELEDFEVQLHVVMGSGVSGIGLPTGHVLGAVISEEDGIKDIVIFDTDKEIMSYKITDEGRLDSYSKKDVEKLDVINGIIADIKKDNSSLQDYTSLMVTE